ncbi:branched-chain amino acid ABC transporter permease [Pigmentiphaga soli]|uniref:Branched-chain amino acid ABC transporter permease n=1 Tax=Pigmentiphaga soli TaxID=1007095 RepID=A0ABP8GUR2_9BURK
MIPQLLLAGLVVGSLYALIAVSLNLVYGTMRLLNCGHGDLVMIGAFVGYGVVVGLGLSPVVGFFVAPMVTGLLGFVLFRTLFFDLSRRLSADGLEAASLLIFFGVSMVVQNTMSYFLTGTPHAYSGYDDLVRIGQTAVSESRLIALTASVALVAAVMAFLRLTMWGIGVRAMIQNREASRIVGIDVERAFALCSVGGFALAGAAGAVLGMQQPATPFMGAPYTTIAFLIVILGGLGNIAGSLAGGLAIGLLETLGVSLTDPSYRDPLIYGLFILVLLLRPQGLFARAKR